MQCCAIHYNNSAVQFTVYSVLYTVYLLWSEVGVEDGGITAEWIQNQDAPLHVVVGVSGSIVEF